MAHIKASSRPSRPTVSPEKIETSIQDILTYVGEDHDREGLAKTPSRVRKSLEYFTKGYAQDPCEILNNARFQTDGYSEMVVVRDIKMFSLCEHHLLPFMGVCHVAYVPDQWIVGLSKLPRVVEVFARRLQVQERLTRQIADTVQHCLQPIGVGVVIEAEHLCMQMRGVEKQESVAITSAMLGAFEKHSATRSEFMTLIRHR